MPKNLSINQKLVPISEAADILDVSPDTVRRWDNAGILNSSRPNGKDRFFDIDELEKVKFSKPLTITEASIQLKISPSTLRRLEARGLIKPERSSGGERLYTKSCLDEFLKSEYFLRQKEVAEHVLEPLEKPEKPQSSNYQTRQKILSAIVAKNSNQLLKISGFRSIIIDINFFVFLFLGLLMSTLTLLFLYFPRETGHFFGYNSQQPNLQLANKQVLGVQTGQQINYVRTQQVVGRALKPFSDLSLSIVKQVSPEAYKQAVPYPQIEDVNQVFALEDSQLVPKQNITFKGSTDLKILKPELIKNLNAEFIQGRIPGNQPGNLVVYDRDNPVFEYPLTFSSPLTRSENTISLPKATSKTGGYISSTDWSVFNSKQESVSTGTTAQYWRGDKSWQTLNASAVGLGSVENTALSTWAGTSKITTLGTVTTGTWQGVAIGTTYGGTGKTGWTQYAIPYLSGTTTFGEIAIGTSGKVLKVNSTATGYEWGDSSGGSTPGGSSGQFQYNNNSSLAGASNLFYDASSDNIGIGTTAPTALVDISGALKVATINGNTFTPGTGTLTIATSKTLTANNTLTLSGTDNSTLNIGSGGTLGSAAFTNSTAYEATGAVSTHAALTATHGVSGAIVGTTDIQTLSAKTFSGDINFPSGIWASSGNVGIGTTAPTALLDVNGALKATTFNGNTITTGTGTLTLGAGKTLTASDTTTLATNAITFGGAEVLTLAAAKNVTFADAFVTSGAYSLTLTTTGTTNVTLPTTGTLATLAGTETFSNKTFSGTTYFPGPGMWDTSGNVGIGTTQVFGAGTKLAVLGGNVGIGTTAPQFPLHIRISSNDTTPNMADKDYTLVINNTNTTNNNRSGIGFGADDMDRWYSGIFGVMTSHTGGAYTSDLSFWTTTSNSSREVMILKNTGNLGIGTTAPSSKLQVAGDIAGTTFNGNTITTGDGTLTLANSLITSGAYSLTLTTTGTTNVTLPTTGTLVNTDVTALNSLGTVSTSLTGMLKASSGVLSAATSGTDYIAGGVGAASQVVYFSNTGVLAGSNNLWFSNNNVGIGTTAPTSKLSVSGTSSTISNSSGNLTITPASNLIISSGNVGVGTTAPTEKFEVSGGNIRVTSGSFIDDGTTLTVPDYVFEPNYNLMPLGTLQEYIQENKHLPGLPNMSDKEGWAALSLQGRDMKILEKVEENILYTIDHEQRIRTIEEKQQTESDAELTKQIQDLEARVKELDKKLAAVAGIQASASPSASISDIVNNNQDLINPELLIATSSATLNPALHITSEATLSGKLTAYQATISDTFKSLGDTFLANTVISGDLSVDGTFSITSGSTINALPTLFIQTSSLAQKVDFFNGTITLDKDGTIITKGDLKVGKNLDLGGAITIETIADEELTPGLAVYISSENKVSKASSLDEQKANTIGITTSSASRNQPIAVATGGKLGYFVNLQVGQKYFLGTEGELVTIPPQNAVDIVLIGTAINKDKLLIQLRPDKRPGATIQASTAKMSIVDPTPTPTEAIAPTPSPAKLGLTIKINENELGFLRVRSDPSAQSEELAKADPGQAFNVLDEQSGWYLIEYQAEKQGWVKGTYVTAATSD